MPSLTRKTRDDILHMMNDEVKLLNEKANERAEEEWDRAEEELGKREGLADNLARAAHLREQIEAMQRELHELLHAHSWRSEEPSDGQYRRAGMKPPQRDSEGRIHSYYMPKVFGHELGTRWNLEVFKIINERMNLLRVQQIVSQVSHSVRRELLLAGTYEEARVAYNQFYQLLRRAGGEEVPALLREITEMPALLPPTTEARN